MFAPWLCMCVYAPLAVLALAAILLARSDHAGFKARRRIGLGVPTRIIFARLDWEREVQARALRDWRTQRAVRDAVLGIKLPPRRPKMAVPA